MHISDEFVGRAMEVCYNGLPVIMAAGGSWPVFFPPRKMRSWPEFTRPLFGMVAAVLAAYALLLLVVWPLLRAEFDAHRGNVILDYPIQFLTLWDFCFWAVPISYGLFLVRVCARCYLRYRSGHAGAHAFQKRHPGYVIHSWRLVGTEEGKKVVAVEFDVASNAKNRGRAEVLVENETNGSWEILSERVNMWTH